MEGEDDEFCLPEDDGLVTVDGGESIEGTASRICEAIREKEKLMLVATVDHAENAASVGKELRPTRLLIFGNPRVGTPLMQEAQSVGIDLPQKMLVWEDAKGGVNVTYDDPEYLAARHGIEGQDDLLEMIEHALSMIAEQESKNEGGA